MGRGYIRKRGKNSWQIAIYRGIGPDGRKLYDYFTVHGTKQKAEQRRTELLHQLDTGQYVEPSKDTLSQYLNRWLAEVELSLKPKTHQFYSYWCEKISQYIGHIPLDKLTGLHIQEMYRELLASGHSPNGVNGAHRTLRRALNQAVEWGLMIKNPVLSAKPPKKQKTSFTILTPEQISKLLAVAKETNSRHQLYTLYLTALSTGMREGELLALRWEDIDFEKQTITVRRTLVRGGRNPIFGEPKTTIGERTVTIPAALVSALKDHRRCQLEHRMSLGPEYHDHGLVWPTAWGWPRVARTLTRNLKILLQKAGLPDIRFHDLRHTHATMLLESGTHPKVVQERLGHSSIDVTMNTYTHVTPNLQKQVASDIEKILFQK